MDLKGIKFNPFKDILACIFGFEERWVDGWMELSFATETNKQDEDQDEEDQDQEKKDENEIKSVTSVFKDGDSSDSEGGENKEEEEEDPFSSFDIFNSTFISFQTFLIHLSKFNNLGSSSNHESKLKILYTLHDFDQDGKIGKSDLVCYMNRITSSSNNNNNIQSSNNQNSSQSPPSSSSSLPEHELDQIVEQILIESSSHPNYEYLTFLDFSKVILSTDYEPKLFLNIL